MSEVQSVVFKKDFNKDWKLSQTRWWLVKNNYKPIKKVHRVYRTGERGKKITQYRWRITDPNQYREFRTKDIGNNILLILGFK